MKPGKRTLRVFQILTVLLAIAALLEGYFFLRLYRDFQDGLAWEVQDDIVDLNYMIKGYLNTADSEEAVLLSEIQRSVTVLSTRLEMVARRGFPPLRENSVSAIGLTRDQLGELQRFFYAFETYLGEAEDASADPDLSETLRGIRILLESYVIGKSPADYPGMLRQAGEDPESVHITFWPIEIK